MSEQLEDLYLKGFMAFNNKDYGAARAFWEKVLAADPGHAKAKQGLEKLGNAGARKKRTSKEVFAEIKQLYGARQYPEALKLTNLLLKKHPDNADLQGLRKKLEARVAATGAPAGAPSAPAGVGEKRDTMFIAAAAEESVAGGEDVSAQVEKLIQQGVSLYEIQDYEAAVDTWKKALALDPGNRIAGDYVANVSALIEGDAKEAYEPDPVPAPEPVAIDDKPSKEKMLEVYNEAMGLYKNRQYHQALERWGYILEYYPNHTETLQCVEKTQALLEKEQAHIDQLDTVRGDIVAGRLTDAESKLTRLSIEAPHLDDLETVRAALNDAKAAQTSSADSLDLGDFAAASAPSGSHAAASATDDAREFSATDDEITSYFGSDNREAGPRKVVAAAPIKPKRKAPVNVFKVFAAVVFLGALGVGGWYGYDYVKKRPPKLEVTEPLVATEVDWNSQQRVVEDFFNFGSDFEDENEFLLASYAYQRVEELAGNRLAALESQDTEMTPEINREIDAISDRLNKSKIQSREVSRKIRGEAVDARALELAKTEMRREEFEEAAQRLKAILNADPKNERAREFLGEVHERLAFRKLAEGDLSGASNHFKCSAVLLPGFDMPRRHMEVIQRYFEGVITKVDKDQWFFFQTAAR